MPKIVKVGNAIPVIDNKAMAVSYPERYIEYTYDASDHFSLSFHGISNVGQYAYYRNTELVNCTFDNDLTEIGQYAFNYCEDLDMQLPPMLYYVDAGAFEGTSIGLSDGELIMPESLDDIGANSFARLKASTVTFMGTPSSISTTAFAQSPSITTINVPWSQGDVAGAPWGAVSATIQYDYSGE